MNIIKFVINDIRDILRHHTNNPIFRKEIEMFITKDGYLGSDAYNLKIYHGFEGYVIYHKDLPIDKPFILFRNEDGKWEWEFAADNWGK